MTMLLVPLSVLASICLNPRTPVLRVTKVPLDSVIRLWADGGHKGVGLVASPSHSQGVIKRKHVSLTVCGICHLMECDEHVTRHCRNFHRQKTLHVPHAYLGRFVVHPDLLEPFITFFRGRGMTDEQESTVRKAFAAKKFLLPPQPSVMMG